ncbi:hypothetical protein, partial [Litoreibacter halocynthiae]|uniref:hypothetical protein n=1 Tax=Litoreibacter halocynthiae TaxID=1242689 RepID=UPI002493838E
AGRTRRGLPLGGARDAFLRKHSGMLFVIKRMNGSEVGQWRVSAKAMPPKANFKSCNLGLGVNDFELWRRLCEDG